MAEPVAGGLSSAGWHSKTNSRPSDLTSVLCSGEGPSRAHTSLRQLVQGIRAEIIRQVVRR